MVVLCARSFVCAICTDFSIESCESKLTCARVVRRLIVPPINALYSPKLACDMLLVAAVSWQVFPRMDFANLLDFALDSPSICLPISLPSLSDELRDEIIVACLLNAFARTEEEFLLL